MAYPAIAEISIAMGTTPTTRMALDLTSVVMLATFQASTKLCHCGLQGDRDTGRGRTLRLQCGREHRQ